MLDCFEGGSHFSLYFCILLEDIYSATKIHSIHHGYHILQTVATFLVYLFYAVLFSTFLVCWGTDYKIQPGPWLEPNISCHCSQKALLWTSKIKGLHCRTNFYCLTSFDGLDFAYILSYRMARVSFFYCLQMLHCLDCT